MLEMDVDSGEKVILPRANLYRHLDYPVNPVSSLLPDYTIYRIHKITFESSIVLFDGGRCGRRQRQRLRHSITIEYAECRAGWFRRSSASSKCVCRSEQTGLAA